MWKDVNQMIKEKVSTQWVGDGFKIVGWSNQRNIVVLLLSDENKNNGKIETTINFNSNLISSTFKQFGISSRVHFKTYRIRAYVWVCMRGRRQRQMKIKKQKPLKKNSKNSKQIFGKILKSLL